MHLLPNHYVIKHIVPYYMLIATTLYEEQI